MMDANGELKRVKEWVWMRGFANLYQKESRAWWSTRRWWINGLLWLGLLDGLVVTLMFIVPAMAEAAGTPMPVVAQALGLKAFFEVGGLAIAIGVVILSQDLIIDEKQTGLAEWLLAKPVQRKAYLLAKLFSSLVSVLLLLIALPGAAAYGLLCLRSGDLFPLLPYLAAMGMLVIYSLFYLTLMLMLGATLSSRKAILGVALGILLIPELFSTLLAPLMYAGPWVLAKLAPVVASSQLVPPGQLWPPLLATALWCVVFTCAAILKFERTEF